MAKVDFPSQVVEAWLIENLGEPGRTTQSPNGTEYCYPEFLVDDNKLRLHVNVEDAAGKFRMFKSSKSGDFVTLVALYDGTTERAAFKKLMGSFGHFLKAGSIQKLVSGERKTVKESRKEEEGLEILFPEKTYPIEKDDEFSRRYIKYLESRWCSPEFIYRCKFSFAKEYKTKIKATYLNFRDYVIIPFYDRFGKIYNWQARCIHKSGIPSYYNPDSAGLFVYNGDTPETEVVLCEGIFDAERFRSQGISTGGKDLTSEQITKICAQSFDLIIIGGNLEDFELGPKAMLKAYHVLKSRDQNVRIFNWMDFCAAHKIKVNKKADFNIIRYKRYLTVEDLKPFLFNDPFEAEMRYKLWEKD